MPEAPRRKPGRPPGRKNKATLLKEKELSRVLGRCKDYLAMEVEPILRAVVDKAKDGDMVAAKLVLDRVLPAQKLQEVQGKALAIQINITPTEVTHGEVSQEGISESRTLEHDATAGPASEGRPSVQIVPLHGNPKGE